MALPDGALWWRLLKKSKNSHCLCAIAVLRNGVKIVARRASRVTHALARTSACFERTLFFFVCDVKRVVSARKGSHSHSAERFCGTKLYSLRIRFLSIMQKVWEVHPSFQSGFKFIFNSDLPSSLKCHFSFRKKLRLTNSSVAHQMQVMDSTVSRLYYTGQLGTNLRARVCARCQG